MKFKHLRRVGVYAIRGAYFTIYALVSAAFFATLQFYFEKSEFAALAVVCGPVLAILFGFTALLYNRARALPSGKEQFRSLYAAERAMQAAVLFVVGVALGGVGAGLSWLVPDIGNLSARPLFQAASTISLLLSLFLVLFAFGSFFMALQTVAHALLRWLPVRRLARRLR